MAWMADSACSRPGDCDFMRVPLDKRLQVSGFSHRFPRLGMLSLEGGTPMEVSMKWNAFILLLSLCFWPHDAARAATSTNAANPTKATSAASVTNAANPAQLVYNSKTTLDAYNSVGRKDPKWDADARKCLSAYARLCSWTNDVPTELIQEVRTNLARALTLGCDDPFMRYLHFRF